MGEVNANDVENSSTFKDALPAQGNEIGRCEQESEDREVPDLP